jgi:uncharacterized membrane protein
MTRYLNPTIILALLVASSAPLFLFEFPFGHDWPYELVRISEFRTALLNGQITPYWGENLYGGLGSPIYLFYAPLYSLIATALSPLTGSIPSAGALALILITLCGLVFMYLFLSEYLRFYGIRNDRAVRIGLYLFALSPYLINDKLIRNADAEFTALCISPLALYGVILIARKTWAGTFLIALGLALTILSHNLTALITFSILIVMAVGLHGVKQPHKLLCATGGMLLGLAMSAFFWIPALAYKSRVQITQITSGKFDFHTQYKPLTQLFGYENFFSVGALAPLVLMIAFLMVYLAWKNRRYHNLVRAMLCVCTIASVFLLLQSPISIPLWESIYFLKLFQFPWRMMGPFSLAIALTGTLLFASVSSRWHKAGSRKMELTVLLLCLLNALPHLLHARALPERDLPERLKAANIQQQVLPATVADEYLPLKANKKLLDLGLRGHAPIHDSDKGLSIDVIENRGGKIALFTRAEEPGHIHLSRWFFPSWGVRIDGNRIAVTADKDGLLTLEVPAGTHYVDAFLTPPLLRQIGNGISSAGLLVLIGLILAQQGIRHRRRPFPARR